MKAKGVEERLKGHLDSLSPRDIVVGILSKDVELTIIHVMNVATSGLLEYFPGYRSAILVCDGYSTDRTRQLAELFELPPQIPKLIVEEEGEIGKGSGVKTVFRIAKGLGAQVVVLLDGDLLSVRPEWVEHLAKPPLYGISDLVIPYYVRHKYDGLITNNLAYPLTRALYGACVRQPIGGEYGLSIELIQRLLEHPLFPHHFGIDIFITTVALAEDLAVQEALLGVKIHESTMKYLDPRKLLFPMFNEVVRTMFELMIYYEDVWRKRSPQNRYRCLAHYHGVTPPPTLVNLQKVKELFFRVYEEWQGVIKDLLPLELFQELQGAIKGGDVMLDMDLWSRLVYALAAAYKRFKNSQVIGALRALWLGRFVTYAKETEELGIEETERLLEEQAKVFERNKEYLLRIF